ncbi:MAG: hypothetical protein WD847_03060 [Pirellulales bacterium]
MAAKHGPKRPDGGPHRRERPGQPQGRRGALKIRRRGSENAYELVHPRCAQERLDDLEEVRQMIDAGELEIATDELRWLLNGCSDFVAAHRLLGELAMEQRDVKLARAHFGYAYDIGLSALPPAGLPGPLPYRVPANQAFLEAAKGLAWCLHELGQHEQALSVLDQLLSCDPSDPLGVRTWLQTWQPPPGEGEGGTRR